MNKRIQKKSLKHLKVSLEAFNRCGVTAMEAANGLKALGESMNKFKPLNKVVTFWPLRKTADNITY